MGKSLLPEKERKELLLLKKKLLEIKKMLINAKEEAEKIDKEKRKEESLIIFKKD